MRPSLTGIWGPPGTIKSTLALTWPKGIAYFEFDPGGYARGKSYLSGEDQQKIKLYTYMPPIRLSTEAEGHKLEGWFENWERFLADIMTSLKDPAIETLVYDTGTLCWQCCHRAYLQQIQKKNPSRESLVQIEYGDVNPWMYSVLNAPKALGKHLVVVFHEDDIREDRLNKKTGIVENVTTGYHKHAGFGHFTKIADLMLHTVVGDKRPFAVIEDHTDPRESVKTGMLPLGLAGFKIPNPTYGKVDTLVEVSQALEREGIPQPADWDDLMMKAGVLKMEVD